MPRGQYTRIQELCGCSCGVTTAANEGGELGHSVRQEADPLNR